MYIKWIKFVWYFVKLFLLCKVVVMCENNGLYICYSWFLVILIDKYILYINCVVVKWFGVFFLLFFLEVELFLLELI